LSFLDFIRRWFRGPAAEAIGGLDPDRTRLIVGLGNPGPEYAETRHNLGFRTVETIARRANVGWQDKASSLHSQVAVVRREEGPNLVLAKPQTFMNRSGNAVRDLIEFLDLDTENALVVYDEMDLPFAVLRLRERGSPGTHNGMRSVVAEVGTDDIPRLRVGISQSDPGQATSHVLSEFAPEEQEVVTDLVNRAADAALSWAEQGAVVAMNRYNKT
jgi:PTH1 family peptidyl-tRNA hydrolase